MDIKPLRFICEPIEVHYDLPPALEKKPGPPDRFTWRNTQYQISYVLSEWFDYSRRGRMARNMTPEHSETAKRRGSWGVGRLYFRIRTDTNRIFDIYYDRAPEDVDNRKGNWFLYQELSEE